MKIGARIKIKGVKPLLICTFPIDTLDSNKPKQGSTGKNEEEWKRTVLMNENREMYIFASYIIGSIREGGKSIKVGKATLSKKVGASLECITDMIMLDGLKVPPDNEMTRLATEPVYLDVRSVVNPMTKGRNLRFRVACRVGWTVSTTIFWDDFAVSADQMKNCLENAGILEGIGDGRKIGFGRYTVEEFVNIKH